MLDTRFILLNMAGGEDINTCAIGASTMHSQRLVLTTSRCIGVALDIAQYLSGAHQAVHCRLKSNYLELFALGFSGCWSALGFPRARCPGGPLDSLVHTGQSDAPTTTTHFLFL
jgi:hypothetical protein